MTDHRGFYMCIDMSTFERGRGYWKLNTSLLQDHRYIEKLNSLLGEIVLDNSFDSHEDKWEYIKVKVKQATIDFSRNKVKEDRIVIANLSEVINDYESRLPLTKEEDELLERSKIDLQEKILERIRGVMFRSKVKWYEEGEKNTKYFYSLEKIKYNAKTCYKIISDQGQELDQPQEILEEQRAFYEKLYSQDDFVNFTLKNKEGIFIPSRIKLEQEKLRI